MALRARLTAPQPLRQNWPWHEVRATSLPLSDLALAERRLEAHTYLASGFGIRLAIQEKTLGWRPLAKLARSWQPPRLKGIVVAPGYGIPYLTATQAFDLRPSPRRFLSLNKVRDPSLLSVTRGDILVTRSGTVGRVTLANVLHENMAISDDLIRVAPLDPLYRGWIYAFLRSPSARQMMTSVHYGHMIKHLEPHHMNALPVPEIEDRKAEWFHYRVRQLLDARNESHNKMRQAEQLFEAAAGGIPPATSDVFEASISSSFGLGRRRLEASFHAPEVNAILRQFASAGLGTQPLSELAHRVWWMSRFKRNFGKGGIPYLSADDLFALNPTATKHILIDPEQIEAAKKFFVQPGWLVMACSGQTYGLNGTIGLVTEPLSRCFLSHDIIRIAPIQEKVRASYLLVALGHPQLGRPLVIRNAYGSSIPHLDPDDVASMRVVRLDDALERTIADAADSAVAMRDEADEIENEVTTEAERIITEFMARI